MMLRLSGIEEVRGKMDVVIPLHVCQGILHDLLSGLALRVLTYPPEREKCPREQLEDARDILNSVLIDLIDGKVGVE